MTLREKISNALEALQTPSITASSLCQFLNLDESTVKLASLSSVLKKMVDERKLVRFENLGPRGGYGYALRENYENDQHQTEAR